jgi:hypothetical protein
LLVNNNYIDEIIDVDWNDLDYWWKLLEYIKKYFS